jgi:hypothetical protein
MEGSSPRRIPSGYAAAYWLRAADIGPVLKRARADSGDIPAAALALRVKAIEHSAAVQRAETLVARLDARMASAQKTGSFKAFNVEYRERRLAAFREGKNFIGYSAARSRLKRAVVDVAAGGSPTGIMKRVFGPQ